MQFGELTWTKITIASSLMVVSGVAVCVAFFYYIT